MFLLKTHLNYDFQSHSKGLDISSVWALESFSSLTVMYAAFFHTPKFMMCVVQSLY